MGLGKVRTVKPSVGSGVVTAEGIPRCVKYHLLTCKVIFFHLEFYEDFRVIYLGREELRDREMTSSDISSTTLYLGRGVLVPIWKGVILNIRDFKS